LIIGTSIIEKHGKTIAMCPPIWVSTIGYATVDVFNTSLDHPMDMLIFCRLSSKDLQEVNIIHVLHRKDCGWMIPLYG
jgi:hypothetical protein